MLLLFTDGSGKVYGVDHSSFAVSTVDRTLKEEIASGKLSVSRDNVLLLPFDKNMFDRVFHTNCYYFWNDMEAACHELYRVLKPNSFMVTCMNMDRVKAAQNKGLFKDANPDPLNYMLVLERTGFKDVGIKYMTCERTGEGFAAISAHVKDKVSDDEVVTKLARQELEDFEEQRINM